ncbi:MAG: acetyl-CoA carboxylase, carboxyltransferase subunit beta [Alphaproteobacteria bacterium]|uniref:Acetyl-coenzyme A carboxylase carboxyl transferase subunit beta n=1 Tax=PS1 clade bacterium TaxID=2175152 RepID=A0A368DRC8_9PROT|nr:acetyl-CoA carboxylase carboxyl transferase subunit beta [Rhodobiaceae bacterium]OUT75016.1 MAG: acetyl-CoA carboxylase, carboxyltransferase subunit beta [Rhizobiales bacterium TMED25]RCL74369.1 MAG: acetyl-CoA carboxylase carboxyltransferase subunit beta [PS1 clade bacterium]|tara:strand:- start:13409 stop:14254 length:846 start_codon:yes stop_codon:yes gene_type:complete
MNWINNIVTPKIKEILAKKDVPDNLWIKCPESGEMVFHKDLEENQWVIPGSNYHMKIPAKKRLELLYDGEYQILDTESSINDPLKFKDEKKYVDRLRDARRKTGMDDAVVISQGIIGNMPVISIVQDFTFMGGTLGVAAGEAIIKAMNEALLKAYPVILFSAAGGARMQEGILSLMQMPRTTIAVQKLNEAKIPYIVVLTNPTTGGVTASYAMLGDVHIAEPGALIGFAGPRVIEQTIKEKLPEGFQRSEYLLEHGMIDMVVHRHDLKNKLITVCKHLLKK